VLGSHTLPAMFVLLVPLCLVIFSLRGRNKPIFYPSCLLRIGTAPGYNAIGHCYTEETTIRHPHAVPTKNLAPNPSHERQGLHFL
jgi:hypothetical protein